MDVSVLAWRECIVPVTAFALKTTFTEHLGAVTHQDLNEAFARLRRIEPWIDAAGGIGKALTSCPLLATWRAGKLHVEDGWHRLGSAVFWHHRTTVRIICADLPSLTSGSSRPDAQNMSRIFFTC